MQKLWQDLRYGARMLWKQPGFTSVVALTLSLGIGANGVIFSLVNALLLRPLPVERPEELAAVYTSDFSSGDFGATSYPDYIDFRDRNRVFTELVAYQPPQPLSLNIDGANERMFGEVVSGNYFSALGLKPSLGRDFLPEEDRRPGESAVAVISHKLWQTRFGGDPATVGRSVKINGHPFTIVGIAPEKYAGLLRGFAVDWWIPAMMIGHAVPGSDYLTERGDRGFLVMGRLKPGAALINESFARRYWPGQPPLDKHIQLGDARNGAITVIGVVKDGKYATLGEDATPFIYLNLAQNFGLSPTLVVRTQGDPLGSLPAVRGEVAALDRNLPLYDVKTMRQHLGLALLPARLAGSVLGVFGLVALTLAAAGVYGVMAYSVAQRTREIGIRMALCANARDVLRLVARQGMTLVAIGMAIGLAAALALTQLLKSLLFGVSATDPLTFVAITLMLMFVALLACWIPARRATKVDPMVALRVG
jgi:hypothetical protein